MKSLNARLFLALVLTLMLSIVPLPDLLSGVRPPLTLMLLIYIQCFIPSHYHLIIVFILGLCVDVLLSTVIGEHAFAFLWVGWMINSKSRRFQFFTIGQQMILVGILCFMYGTVILLVDAFSGYTYSWLNVLLSAFTSVLFWPWLKVLANDAFRIEIKTQVFR